MNRQSRQDNNSRDDFLRNRLAAPVRRTPEPQRPPKPREESQEAAKAAPAGTTLSINIHLPKLNPRRFTSYLKPLASLWGWWFVVSAWVRAHKWWSIGGGILAALLVFVIISAPLHLNEPKKTASGSAQSTSAGGRVGSAQPDFEVVVPKTKLALATPDGKDAAYDSLHDSYSFKDSLQNIGFIVSQQPIPKQFSSGQEAVDKIAPTLASAGTSPQAISTNYGKAYVITNTEAGSQVLVAHIKKVIVFIRVGHIFSDSDWISYLNSLT